MDLGKQQIRFNCPECDFINSTTLEDVAAGKSVVCVGCLKTIQLNDANGSTKKAIGDVNNALNRLKDTINGH